MYSLVVYKFKERLTTQVASGLLEVLDAHGVAVVLEASHFCMVMRGVQKQNSKTVTSSMLGAFREDSRSRSEFMELLEISLAISVMSNYNSV